MRYKLILLFLAFIIVLGCGITAKKPAQVANEFYATLLQSNIRGLPTERDEKSINALLTFELRSTIAKAKRVQKKFIAESKKKGEILKAPWSDGNLFGSNYEGMTSFSLGQPQISDEIVSIPVYLEYITGKDGEEPVIWIDILVLKKTGEGWKVHDLFFCAPWDFGYRGNLRGILSASEDF